MHRINFPEETNMNTALNKTTWQVDTQECCGCSRCLKSCPMEILKIDKEICSILDEEKCIECGACVRACPKGAIEVSNVIAPKRKFFRSSRQKQENAPAGTRYAPIFEQLTGLLDEIGPVQQFLWKDTDVSRLNEFKVEGHLSTVRCYQADALEKIGAACINFYGMLQATIITVAPGKAYDIPCFSIDWDESADHIFFYCDLLPTDDPVRNPEYLQRYLYEPLEDLYQRYCNMPGLKSNAYHWARAFFSPYVLTGTIDKSNSRALGQLYSCAADYLRAWIGLWKSAAPREPDSEQMRLVQARRHQIGRIIHAYDPGGPPMVKLVGRETADIIMDIVLP